MLKTPTPFDPHEQAVLSLVVLAALTLALEADGHDAIISASSAPLADAPSRTERVEGVSSDRPLLVAAQAEIERTLTALRDASPETPPHHWQRLRERAAELDLCELLHGARERQATHGALGTLRDRTSPSPRAPSPLRMPRAA